MNKLIGRENISSAWHNILARNHLRRSFLILGGKELGKTFTGKKFASMILGDRVFRNSHPDFIYLDGKQNDIDLLDKFETSCFKQPYEGKRVVVFFDNIDHIPSTVTNKLLKTVEEPPENTTIILSAEGRQTVLNTIQSRCSIWELPPLDSEHRIEILLDNGIEDARERLEYTQSLSIAKSMDFSSFKNRADKHKELFKAMAYSKEHELQELYSKQFLKITSTPTNLVEFLEDNLDFNNTIEFKKRMQSFIKAAKSSMNRYVLARNISFYIQQDCN